MCEFVSPEELELIDPQLDDLSNLKLRLYKEFLSYRVGVLGSF